MGRRSNQGPIGITVFNRGAILEITQIDTRGRKVIGPDLRESAHWDTPATKIEE